MLVWKRNIDGIISFFYTNKYVVNQFFEQANKLTISKSERFNKESVFDMTNRWILVHNSTQRVTYQEQRKALLKAKNLDLKGKFEYNIRQFKAYLAETEYQKNFIDNLLAEVKFKGRKRALLQHWKQAIESCPLW